MSCQKRTGPKARLAEKRERAAGLLPVAPPPPPAKSGRVSKGASFLVRRRVFVPLLFGPALLLLSAAGVSSEGKGASDKPAKKDPPGLNLVLSKLQKKFPHLSLKQLAAFKRALKAEPERLSILKDIDDIHPKTFNEAEKALSKGRVSGDVWRRVGAQPKPRHLDTAYIADALRFLVGDLKERNFLQMVKEAEISDDELKKAAPYILNDRFSLPEGAGRIREEMKRLGVSGGGAGAPDEETKKILKKLIDNDKSVASSFNFTESFISAKGKAAFASLLLGKKYPDDLPEGYEWKKTYDPSLTYRHMIGTDDYELYEHSPEEKQYQPAKTNEAYFTNCQEYRDLASRHKRIVEHQRQGWRNRGGLWEECYCPNSDAFGSSSVEYDRIPCYEMEETDAPAAEQNTDRDACKKYKEAAAKHGYEIGKPRFEGQECGCYKTFKLVAGVYKTYKSTPQHFGRSKIEKGKTFCTDDALKDVEGWLPRFEIRFKRVPCKNLTESFKEDLVLNDDGVCVDCNAEQKPKSTEPLPEKKGKTFCDADNVCFTCGDPAPTEEERATEASDVCRDCSDDGGRVSSGGSGYDAIKETASALERAPGVGGSEILASGGRRIRPESGGFFSWLFGGFGSLFSSFSSFFSFDWLFLKNGWTATPDPAVPFGSAPLHQNSTRSASHFDLMNAVHQDKK